MFESANVTRMSLLSPVSLLQFATDAQFVKQLAENGIAMQLELEQLLKQLNSVINDNQTTEQALEEQQGKLIELNRSLRNRPVSKPQLTEQISRSSRSKVTNLSSSKHTSQMLRPSRQSYLDINNCSIDDYHVPTQHNHKTTTRQDCTPLSNITKISVTLRKYRPNGQPTINLHR